MATILLSGIDIADVHLDDRSGNGSDGIVDGHTGVAIASSIEDDAVGGEAHLMQTVDDFAFDIALVLAYLGFGETAMQVSNHLLHGDMPVNIWLTPACEVQIGPVDDFYLLHGKILLLNTQKVLYTILSYMQRY